MARRTAPRRAARAEDLVAIDDLAAQHRASPTAIRRAIERGELEAVGYRDFLRVRRCSFLAWHLGRLRGAAVIVDH